MRLETDFKKTRVSFIETVIRPMGIENPRLIEAFLKVPREEFVNPNFRKEAYWDTALPLDFDQTISQPSLVAVMTDLLQLTGNEKVLEIGTGSGYQAAILSFLAKEVHTVERITALAERAEKIFNTLGYKNIFVHISDGNLGWAEEAPYEAVIVTAAAFEIPQALLDQMAKNSRMIIPVEEDGKQILKLVLKVDGEISTYNLSEVVFVPLQKGTV